MDLVHEVSATVLQLGGQEGEEGREGGGEEEGRMGEGQRGQGLSVIRQDKMCRILRETLLRKSVKNRCGQLRGAGVPPGPS